MGDLSYEDVQKLLQFHIEASYARSKTDYCNAIGESLSHLCEMLAPRIAGKSQRGFGMKVLNSLGLQKVRQIPVHRYKAK